MSKSPGIETERIKILNRAPVREEARYVLYWMQQSQRADFNPALEYAAYCANASGKPLVVGFGLMENYPEANARHYTFMLEGLQDVQQRLARRGIMMTVRRGAPAAVALELGADAALIVCDRGYLRHQKAWRAEVTEDARCRVVQVEGDVIVPVETASEREEFAARTLRPKLTRRFASYLHDLKPVRPVRSSTELTLRGIDLSDPARICASLKIDKSVPAVSHLFRGGCTEAKRVFREFLARRLRSYAGYRNKPETDFVSHMSKYLHFGQISPVWLVNQVRNARGIGDVNARSFIEELLVRRELAINYVHFNPRYDDYAGLPEWVRNTLAAHATDRRPVVYPPADLEAGRTHDTYWNAAMREMRETGYMHNYMRMYWGKKILEWSKTPEEAFRTILRLNNKYFLDGRDALSFANVAWVFGKHDRPFAEREIFGKIRWMSAAGLERKCNIKEYVSKVDRMVLSFAVQFASHSSSRRMRR